MAYFLNRALKAAWKEWGEDTTEDQIAIQWLNKYNDDGTVKTTVVKTIKPNKRRKRGKQKI